MAEMLIAAFRDNGSADLAVDELLTLGYSVEDLSVITKDTKNEGARDLANDAAEGAASGAVTGGTIGGIAGLLAGAGVIPALAGFLIGGPLAVTLGATGVAATTISGAVTGAVAGGLIGALVGLGLSEEDARYYDSTVNEGGSVIAVPLREGNDAEVRTVLDRHQAQQVRTVTLPA